MFKMDLEKAEEPEIKLPASTRSSKKQENSRKSNIYFCFIESAEAFDSIGSQKTVENSSRDGTIKPPYLPPEKPLYRSRSIHS